MYGTLFRQHYRHVFCAFGAGRDDKTDFSHESVRKQQKFASEKTRSYWWKKAPHQLITKLHGKTRDLVAGEQGEVVEGPAVTVREMRDL